MDENIDEIVDLLTGLNCPYLSSSDTRTEHRKWITGVVTGVNEDRLQILHWCLDQIHPSIKTNIEDNLQMLGICSSPENAKNFVSGQKGDKQERGRWMEIFDLMGANARPAIHKTDLQAQLKDTATCIDNICENVPLARLLEKPYNPASYQFEKELKRLKLPPNEISVEALKILADKAGEEKEALLAKAAIFQEPTVSKSVSLPPPDSEDSRSTVSSARTEITVLQQSASNLSSKTASSHNDTCGNRSELTQSGSSNNCSSTTTPSNNKVDLVDELTEAGQLALARGQLYLHNHQSQFQHLLARRQQHQQQQLGGGTASQGAADTSGTGNNKQQLRRSLTTTAYLSPEQIGSSLTAFGEGVSVVKHQLDRLAGIVASFEGLTTVSAELRQVRLSETSFNSNDVIGPGIGDLSKTGKTTPGAM